MPSTIHHVTPYTLADLCGMIDHTNLRADVTEMDLSKLCMEAQDYGFHAVCVGQTQAAYVSFELRYSSVNTGVAISFPTGQTTVKAKLAEVEDAIHNGANEIDYVVNLTQVKRHNWAYVKDEMKQIVDLCHTSTFERGGRTIKGVTCKVIFENCYLDEGEKIHLCQIAREVGPDFVKTSTGFGKGGATIADVELMRQQVGSDIKVKAAGGIRDAETFLAMVRAGASRIGCSAGVSIANDLKARMEAEGTGCLLI